MNKAIIGKKLGMTQVFTSEGKVIPVTVIEAGPCYVSQIKTEEKDGYKAVQLAYDETREKLMTKPEQGHLKKANLKPMKVLKEFRLDNSESYTLGQEIKCDIFTAGDIVDASGTTRGRGFTGVLQRWNQQRLKETHGTGPVHRHPGSMGSGTTPGRVMKGKKLAGQYGHEKVTVLNLTVVKVDAERGVLLIKGAIPGPKGSVVSIKNAVKA